ncbi:ACT domain-containing protein [Candidatus Micrarchaeota archaeon]|nr:ACT domain-containing protein [Candidatus Micrarchaeota archaeon]
MKPVTIVAKDRVGLLSDISYILRMERINLESLDATVIGGTIVITVFVKDPKRASIVLAKNGFKNLEQSYLVLKLDDVPKSYEVVTTMLKNAKINILQFHILSSDGKNAVVGIKADRPRAAKKTLRPYLSSGL